MRIAKYELEAINEPIKTAFAFKGRFLAKPFWNTALRLTEDGGQRAMGLSNQAILWSDAEVYERFSYTGGNSLMYLMSEFALKLALTTEFDHPTQLLRTLLPQVWAYGKKISALPTLRETFALNALVAVDTAAWLLYAKTRGIHQFDQLIPEHAKSFMQTKHDHVAAIPLVAYSATEEDILKEVEGGSFALKIKIGADPQGDGDYEKMLKWDQKRLYDIHQLLKDRPCIYADNGHIPYYLDANGRYDSKDRLMRLVDYADSIGALSRIMLLEEPFNENLEIDVGDIPLRVAADESAHSDADVRKRIDMGYKAIALKPIAKTMSMTFDMIGVCGQYDIPCFCADLTVNPWMVDLNKNFAARLRPVPGVSVGLLESNGHQFYQRWDEMCAALPYPQGTWVKPQQGLYVTDNTFYEKSGGFFGESVLHQSVFA